MGRVREMGQQAAEGRCEYASPDETWTCEAPTGGESDRCLLHRETDAKSRAAVLRAMDASEGRLVGSYLRGVDLTGVSFRGVDLSYADFTNADVSEASFREANLREAVFSKTDVEETDFDRADLSSAQFAQVDLSVASFGKPKISRTTFWRSTLRGIDFFEIDLPGARFRESDLTAATFCPADYAGTVFSGATLTDAVFQRATLSEAYFNNCDLRNASFASCTLSGTQMRNSLLAGADFRGATVDEAILRGSDLSGANLRDASFVGGEMEEVNLERADVRGADLRDARLYQAILHDVRIDDFTEFGQTSPHSFDDGETERRYGRDGHLAAAWVFQRIEGVYRVNAMLPRAWEYHVLEKESVRRHHRERITDDGTYGDRAEHLFQWVVTTFSYHLTRHGKSVGRPLAHSALLVVLFGLVYPFTGFVVGSTTYGVSDPVELLSVAGVGTLLQAMFFSFTMFVLGDFGDAEAVGTAGMVLAEVESVLGIVLIAILLFVYGLHITE